MYTWICSQVCNTYLKILQISGVEQYWQKVQGEKGRIRPVCRFGIGDISVNSMKGREREGEREYIYICVEGMWIMYSVSVTEYT